MNTKQKIAGIDVTGIVAAKPTTGEPICEWVDPRSLYVDHEYQRKVGEKGLRQIRRIVQNFCWAKFKPPVCAYSDHEGRTVLMVLDGQHTAIAAVSNPYINMIPIMIVDAPDTQSQASAFVGQNTERVGVTPLQLHQASVVAGDPEAQTVELVCARANVKIVKSVPGGAKYQPRETIAISSLRGLIDRHSAPGARRILEVLADGGLSPITSQHIKAGELLMSDKEYASRFEPADLSIAIGELFLTAEDEAKTFAHMNRIPVWRALAAVWFRKTRKKKAMRLAS
ncbi:hypothetical protein C7441_12151 [Pseudaminobacter salicylatoxidans]|uniref:ParB-like nuclease family protein n=1 Tax=Pseudaminobacter salicylatoxidans TaxID=93369 RepID=A0A316BP24_PSESE|nr:hypothetical protein [Pseudaminobacter salicylatoxidans]PWJ75269.1 hypothetical protein C7441_12151 [Pseudaminobacter salicylatoxidans]